jgi:hypothetical protein
MSTAFNFWSGPTRPATTQLCAVVEIADLTGMPAAPPQQSEQAPGSCRP